MQKYHSISVKIICITIKVIFLIMLSTGIVTYLTETKQSKILMEKNPKDLLSVRLRENIIKPLIVIQQYALSQYNEFIGKDDGTAQLYADVVVQCSFGIINAARNSA